MLHRNPNRSGLLRKRGQLMRISVEEASEMMGISPQAIRIQMQRKIIDIGYVAGTKQHRTYIIFREKVERLIHG